MRDFSKERLQVEGRCATNGGALVACAAIMGGSGSEEVAFAERLAAAWNACRDALDALDNPDNSERPRTRIVEARAILRRAVHGEG